MGGNHEIRNRFCENPFFQVEIIQRAASAKDSGHCSNRAEAHFKTAFRAAEKVGCNAQAE
jgi:hypothetical protein